MWLGHEVWCMRYMSFELVFAGFLLVLSYLWSRTGKSADLPRIGPPTIFGYIWTALRFTFQNATLIAEGREKFSGRPFIVPTSNGSLIIVGPDNIEVLQQSNDTVFSQPVAIDEFLTLHQTMNKHQLENPYHLTVVRTDLTRGIPSLIPEVFDEMTLAMSETLNIPDESDSFSIPVFNTMVHMLGRITNRALVGVPLCRDPKYVDAMVRFAEGVVLYAQVLKFCPVPLRDMIYLVLSSIFGGKKEGLKRLTPLMKELIANNENVEDQPHTFARSLVRVAPPEELADPARLAMRVMNMNFGSIHTSSLTVTDAIFELALLPQAQQDEIRTEVRQALADEGGWNKESLAKFRKLDSLLKEIGRVQGLSRLVMIRTTIQDGTLPDGTVIPTGYKVSMDMTQVHMNPEIYPEPEVFDPFRFSKLAEKTGNNAKYGFTAVDKNYLLFGLGRHACPGRFLAAMQVKMVLAYILLNYDIAYPGVASRPEKINIAGTIIPDTKARLVFKRRI